MKISAWWQKQKQEVQVENRKKMSKLFFPVRENNRKEIRKYVRLFNKIYLLERVKAWLGDVV